MPNTLSIIAGVAAGLSILSLFVGLYRILRPAGELETRLEQSVKRTVNAHEEPETAGTVRGGNSFRLNEKLAGKTALMLEQADLALTVNEYVLIRFGGAAAALLFGLMGMRNILIGLVLALAALQVPVFVVYARCRRRQQRFQGQLVDLITMLASGLRAGVGLMQAMDLVRREMPDPAGEEFGRVLREVGLGVSLSDALAHLLERMPGDDLAMVVTVINIQAEVGGNLAAILESVVTTIRERVRIAQEIRTLTAQQRMTGYMLAGMPFVVGAAVYMINPEYMAILFDPKWIVMPIAAVVMIGLGFIVINRMVDIKV